MLKIVEAENDRERLSDECQRSMTLIPNALVFALKEGVDEHIACKNVGAEVSGVDLRRLSDDQFKSSRQHFFGTAFSFP